MTVPECGPERTPPSSPPVSLSKEHRQMLEEGSAILRSVTEERGVCTITDGRELPRGFSNRQRRRGEGILFTIHRPNGKRDCCFRPDAPDPEDPGRKYEMRCKGLGGRGNVLDVHPRVRHLTGDTRVPVIFVEGIKKADAIISAASLASVEVLVVAISGVWNWLSDGAPIPDMFDIPFDHRKVDICFDSDVFSNPDVQDALRRLAEHVIERGATVKLAHLPDQPDGSKMGADDFLAGGSAYTDLLALMRPYDPEDLGHIRLSRDERLRACIDAEWGRWWSFDWSRLVGTADNPDWRRGHTTRDVMKILIDEAKRRGKVKAHVVEVSPSTRRLTELSAKSRPSVCKALHHLEAEGFIEIVEAEAADKPHTYRLLAGCAVLGHKGGKDPEAPGTLPDGKGPRAGPDLPRLRWSSPAIPKRRGLVRGTRRVRQGPSLASRAGVKRLGPGRGAAVDYMERVQRRVPLAEMAEALGVARPRDLVRRKTSKKGRDGRLVMLLDAGILVFDGESFDLPPDWRSRLEEARVLGGEIECEEQDRERHRRQREAFRNRGRVKESRHWVNVGADGATEDLERIGPLSHVDAEILEAIRAFEDKYGRGSFRWDRASCKAMFYSGPISGLWPEMEELARIRAYVEAAGGLRAAA